MADSLDPSTPSSARSDDGESEEQAKKPDTTATTDSKLECPVCLQTCVHPVRLPCGHIFCFLCVKGVAFKNLRCALCRCDIPLTYLDHPQLVNGVEEIERAATTAAEANHQYQWYYEGRNGWWQYDERTSQELEEAYGAGEKSCKILVAGFVYIVNFEHRCQIRQNDYSRIRRVKRDLVTIPKKGVAGLRLEPPPTQPGSSSTADMHELSSALGEMNLNEGASTSAAAVAAAPEAYESVLDGRQETTSDTETAQTAANSRETTGAAAASSSELLDHTRQPSQAQVVLVAVTVTTTMLTMATMMMTTRKRQK
ncbi:ring finger protein [Anopheles darlingi]|uniref:E3 ubiquitin-protein ligase n=1 Tax=Anopheles darlingi TaxID=43151 RepID=W5JWF8_ANODA|nr:LOW QUALITY PROTEIN: E3 ubiquitin-protein ligase rnf146 [Anopheles darlingi]ETN67329.1 ring finger protein [Anopheles darlingi]